MLKYVLGAEITSGAELIIEAAGIEEALEEADLLITGEGCSDEQTLCGKLPAVVAGYAARQNVPAVLCSGAVTGGFAALEKVFAGVFSISNGALSLDEAILRTGENLRLTGANLAGLATAFASKSE